MLLVGDVGGTKTLIARYSPDARTSNELVDIKSFKSQEYNNIYEILECYLQNNSSVNDITGISLAVAGPVYNNQSKLTNLDWDITPNKLIQAIGNTKKEYSILVSNDLEAIGNAVCNNSDYLDVKSLHINETCKTNNTAPKLIVAPGTGLGMAYAVNYNGFYHVKPSQGGHISFAPVNQQQIELLKYMQEKLGVQQVGLEQVCSGIGIVHLFEFVINYRKIELDSKLNHELQNSEDIVPLIVANALGYRCEACVHTIELFVEILAMAVQTMALISNSLGGIYLAGGIALALENYLSKPLFLNNFLNNSLMSDLLGRMPIYICRNRNIALIGAVKLLNNK